MTTTKTTEPFILTIFGASGDLAKIKLFPTLFELARQKRYPKQFAIYGYARSQKTTEAFREEIAEAIRTHAEGVKEKTLQDFLKHVHYFSGQYDNLVDFANFKETWTKQIKRDDIPHICYFSVPPIAFEPIISNLANTRETGKEDIRLVLEKPFGLDGASARALYHFASQHFSEDQMYLLDHYLGKSSVQSIMHLRRSNRMLGQMLTGREISNIQITAAESVGVKDRASYFDHTGTTKDMVQSHLLQLLALLTMDLPCAITAQSIQREKASILQAIRPVSACDDVVFGQYKGYAKEPGVEKKSQTETFSSLRLFIDRQDWFGVPVYLRSGKKLRAKHTYAVVEFKKYPFQSSEEQPNRLIIELQPFERVHVSLMNYHGDVQASQEVMTSDSIACSIEGCLPDHGTLLLDVLRGDQTFFLSFEEILACWDVVDPIISAHQEGKIVNQAYQSGGSGPKLHLDLPKAQGYEWFDLSTK
jgi:glucose-6-phosphate 1-dehydrogenase